MGLEKLYRMNRQNLYAFLSIPAFCILYLFTALMIFAGFPFLFLRLRRPVGSMMRFWAKGIFLLMGKKIVIEGRENIERTKKFILLANHSSLFDIIAIISVFPDIVWFGHERLMKIPVFRRVLILTGYIPMRKATYRNTREMIDNLVRTSKKHNIAIFPEGTRTLDGKMNDFYRGFIMLLRFSEVDVLPVTLDGFFRLKPKNRGYIDFNAELKMVIHKIIPGRKLTDKSDREIALTVRSVIESAMDSEPDFRTGNELVVKPETVKR